GHALGLGHSNVVSAEMYGVYNGVKSTLNADDVNGIRNIYSSNHARSQDPFGANTSFATATDVTSTINATTLTSEVSSSLDSASDQDYFPCVAPSGSASSLTVTAQSAGLSLLAPKLTVYAADQQTVLGSASGLGQYGTTLSVTVNGVTAGQRYYAKVSGADTSVFATGAYTLTLNLGTGSNPTVSPPNTQLLNGDPTTGGGGQPVELSYEPL